MTLDEITKELFGRFQIGVSLKVGTEEYDFVRTFVICSQRTIGQIEMVVPDSYPLIGKDFTLDDDTNIWIIKSAIIEDPSEWIYIFQNGALVTVRMTSNNDLRKLVDLRRPDISPIEPSAERFTSSHPRYA